MLTEVKETSSMKPTWEFRGRKSRIWLQLEIVKRIHLITYSFQLFYFGEKLYQNKPSHHHLKKRKIT